MYCVLAQHDKWNSRCDHTIQYRINPRTDSQITEETRSTVSQKRMCLYLQHQSKKEQGKRNHTPQNGALKAKAQDQQFSFKVFKVEQSKVCCILFLYQSCAGPDPHWSGKVWTSYTWTGMRTAKKKSLWYRNGIEKGISQTKQHL